MNDQEHIDSGSPSGNNQWDAFEKDAAEGFALLNSDEAVTDLKAKTDADMKARLQTLQPAKQSSWHRLAIAAIFIFAGLALVVWLLPERKTEMALRQDQSPRSVVEPTPAPVPPSHQAIAEEPKKEKIEGPSKSTLNRTERSSNKALDETAAEEPLVAAEGELASAADISDHKQALATKDAEEKMVSNFQERKKESEISTQKSKTPTPTVLAASSPVVISSGAATYSWSASNSMTKLDSAQKDNKGSLTGIVLLNSVSYPGGNSALKKDIQKILVKENSLMPLHLQFDIDRTGKVIKVQLLEKANMGADQELKVLEALKTVKLFKIKLVEGGQLPAMYDFEFKP